MSLKISEKARTFVPIKALPKRKCLTCAQEFAPKRAEQKFCSEECRNGYHNSKNRNLIAPFKKSVKSCQAISMNTQNPALVEETLEILFKNREILHNLYTTGQKEVAYAHLKMLGFDSTVFTGAAKSTQQSFVFDYGLQTMSNGLLKITQRT
jgi:predicted nucleic acid-binding Zn ribbon protein